MTTVLLLALGLSMDAFAVTISNVMCYSNLNIKGKIAMPITFGIFQGLMPLIGFLLGAMFASQVENIAHWIALAILAFLGIRTIVESIKERKEQCDVHPFDAKLLFTQAIATSIDALAVGVTLAVSVPLRIVVSVSIIAVVTMAMCFVGLYIGKVAGKFFKDYAGIFGGAVLIAIGLKIFIEHYVG